MLERVLRRVRRSNRLDQVVVATTQEPEDDSIVDLCEELKVATHRGAENDLLSRYRSAAEQFNAETVVRVTSDCPLIDPAFIDHIVTAFHDLHPTIDVATNTHPDRTYPHGINAQVTGDRTLARLDEADDDPERREHVFPYAFEHPDEFRTHCLRLGEDLSHHRWTVDWEEDLELVRRIYEAFDGDRFAWTDVLEKVRDNPEWIELNSHRATQGGAK